MSLKISCQFRSELGSASTTNNSRLQQAHLASSQLPTVQLSELLDLFHSTECACSTSALKK